MADPVVGWVLCCHGVCGQLDKGIFLPGCWWVNMEKGAVTSPDRVVMQQLPVGYTFLGLFSVTSFPSKLTQSVCLLSWAITSPLFHWSGYFTHIFQPTSILPDRQELQDFLKVSHDHSQGDWRTNRGRHHLLSSNMQASGPAYWIVTPCVLSTSRSVSLIPALCLVTLTSHHPGNHVKDIMG